MIGSAKNLLIHMQCCYKRCSRTTIIAKKKLVSYACHFSFLPSEYHIQVIIIMITHSHETRFKIFGNCFQTKKIIMEYYHFYFELSCLQLTWYCSVKHTTKNFRMYLNTLSSSSGFIMFGLPTFFHNNSFTQREY